MARHLGTVRVGEDLYPVDWLELRDGALRVGFQVLVTTSTQLSDALMLFGPDGSLVVRDRRLGDMPEIQDILPHLAPGDVLAMTWSLSVNGKLTEQARADLARVG